MVNINSNLPSIMVQSNLTSATNSLNKAIEKLTTGFKINHASDNAANYSIANDYSSKLSSYDVASNNIAAGMDLVATAQDTISLMQSHGQRIHALITQAKNGTYGAKSLDAINSEINARIAEITRLYETTEYNGINLFDGMVYPDFVNDLKSELTPKYNGFIKNPVTHSQSEAEALTNVSEVNSFNSGQEYEIGNLADLKHLRDLVNSGKSTSNVTFVMSTDIDMSEDEDENWTPISNNYQFQGTFDGNGHVIKNLHIDTSGSDKGLFGKTGGYIRNLGITNAYVVNGGPLAGSAINNGEIYNCYSSGTVKNGSGLVGGIQSILVSYCYSTCSVSGGTRLSGLVGSSWYGAIDHCFSAGDVQSTSNDGVGGLLAWGPLNYITNSYTTGNIKAGYRVGGLVGQLEAGFAQSKIENCFSTGDVECTNGRGGGLFGEARLNNSNKTLSIKNVMASGTITGGGTKGSLIGDIDLSNIDKFSISNAKALSQNLNKIGNISDPGNALIQNITEGVFRAQMNMQVGINGDDSCRINVDTSLNFDLSYLTQNGAQAENAYSTINDFLNSLSERATSLGAVSNRLESALESTGVSIENLTSSLSTIKDADISKVSSEYIKHQILQQASATLLATANQTPSIALQLL